MDHPSPAETSPEREDADIAQNKDIAAFAYIWMMAVVVYAARPHSPFARFHSKQGLVLFFLSFLALLPWVGTPILLLLVAGMVLGFIRASRGEKYLLPIVGPLSKGEWSVQALRASIISQNAKASSTAKPQSSSTPPAPPSTL